MAFNKSFHRILKYHFLAYSIIFLIACSSQPKDERSMVLKENNLPDTLSMLVKFDNSLFPLPSPYQAASLIHKHNISFDESLANSTENYKNYSTAFVQALNIGFYGTDLSYFNVYEKTPQAVSYLGVIKKLSDQLGISMAFDKTFFSAIEKNINNKDSLLALMSRTFQSADSYLRANDRESIGALIIAGGWIESVYILTKIAKSTNNREIINRIGEQKHPLVNLIEILSPYYYKSDEFAELIDALYGLDAEFDNIIYSYSYKEPKIDVKNKIIYINSESRIVMSEYHLDTITKKIEDIRNKIIG